MMEILTVVIAIIAPVSALAGVVLTSRSQQQSATQQHYLKANTDKEVLERSIQLDNIKEAESRLIDLHKVFGSVRREFSMTNLVIMRDEKIPSAEYNQRYLGFSEKFDETLASIHIYEPALYDDACAISGALGNFWFNFMLLLELTYRTEEAKAELLGSFSDTEQRYLDGCNTAITKIEKLSIRMQRSLVYEFQTHQASDKKC